MSGPAYTGVDNLEAMADKLVFDNLNHAAVTFCVDGARENARQVREEISTEQWQRLNRLYHQIHSPQAETQFSSSINDALASIIDITRKPSITASIALVGSISVTMTLAPMPRAREASPRPHQP